MWQVLWPSCRRPLDGNRTSSGRVPEPGVPALSVCLSGPYLIAWSIWGRQAGRLGPGTKSLGVREHPAQTWDANTFAFSVHWRHSAQLPLWT